MKSTLAHPYPRVGVCVLVTKDGQYLLGLRQGAHGEGTWAPPGGKLDLEESWEDCAKREVLEETSLRVNNLRFVAATNDIFEREQLHYITLFMKADWASGIPQVLEPEKCQKWGWFPPNQLPDPLFLPIQNLQKFYPALLLKS